MVDAKLMQYLADLVDLGTMINNLKDAINRQTAVLTKYEHQRNLLVSSNNDLQANQESTLVPSMWDAVANSHHIRDHKGLAAGLTFLGMFVGAGVSVDSADPGPFIVGFGLTFLFIPFLLYSLLVDYSSAVERYNSSRVATLDKIGCNELAIQNQQDQIIEKDKVIRCLRSKLNSVIAIYTEYLTLNILHPYYRKPELIPLILRFLQTGQATTLPEAYTLCDTAAFRNDNLAEHRKTNAFLGSISNSLDTANRQLALLNNEISANHRQVISNLSRTERVLSEVNGQMIQLNESALMNNRYLECVAKYDEYLAFSEHQQRLAAGKWY